MKRKTQWNKKHAKYWRCIKSRKRCLRDKDHKSNVGHNRGERCLVTYCRGFEWLGQPCPCCAQASVFQFPATNVFMSGLMQPHNRIAANVLVKTVVACWFISEGFSETLLFTTGSTVLRLTLACFLAAGDWVYLLCPQDGVDGVSYNWPSGSANYCGRNKEKTSSHHYHDICKLWWWFSNYECWYAAYCFNYSKLLFQTMP